MKRDEGSKVFFTLNPDPKKFSAIPLGPVDWEKDPYQGHFSGAPEL